MDDDDAVTTIVTEILRKALWNITYHEYELKKAHSTKALVIALLKRIEMTMTYAEAKAICDEIEDEDFFKSFNEFIAYTVKEAYSSIEFHEEQLSKGHADLASGKALIQRVGLNLSLDEIQAKVNKQFFAEE